MGDRYIVRLGREAKPVEVEEREDGLWVRLDGEWHSARLEPVGSPYLYILVIDNRPQELFALERAGGYDITIGWDRYSVAVSRRGLGLAPAPGEGAAERAGPRGWVVLSPLTGVVAQVHVRPGQAVGEGDVLLTIEAMKMQNELRSQRGGIVREVYVREGQRVEQGSSLLLLSEER